MIANTNFVMTMIILTAYPLILSPNANALPIKSGPYGGSEHPFKRKQSDEEDSMSLYIRSPLPSPNGAFHTVSVNNLEVMGASPDMLLPQHANTKKLKGSVFLKRSEGELETSTDLQKRFYALEQIAVSRGTMTPKEAQDRVARQVAMGKRMVNAVKEKPFKKRFYLDDKSAKALYAPHKPGEPRILARDAGNSDTITPELKKRFFLSQQLAVFNLGQHNGAI